MSVNTRNVPMNYRSKFILPYRTENDINEELVNETKDIIDFKKSEINSSQIIGTPTVPYNPIYEPTNLIQYAVDRAGITKKNNENVIENITEKDKQYDPYKAYLVENGLINDSSEIRYNVEYINIDSRHRNKSPSNVILNVYNIDKTSMSISANNLIINLTDSTNFYIGQKVSIAGLLPYTQIYRYNLNGIMTFTANSSYIKFSVNCNINYPQSSYQKIDTSKLYVTISGITGNDLSTYIGNIPINLINKTQQIYLTSDYDSSGTLNTFYIKLPIVSNGLQATSTFNIKFEFEHYNGIPIFEINADYPINNYHTNGYQVINAINSGSLYFQVYPPVESSLYQNISYNNFGNTNMYLKTIESINKGYPNSNSYTLQLPKTYSGIVQVKSISSIFPNVLKAFKAAPSDNQNNLLYFQDIDNGNEIQVIELEEGNYTSQEFIDQMENKFSQLTRTNDISGSVYLPNYYVKINIKANQDLIEFNNYRKAILSKPIITVTPPIQQADTSIGVGSYKITLNHSNHNITSVGTEIILENFIDHLGISALNFNGVHKVVEIIDENRYSIELTNINLSPTKNITNGGFNATVLKPGLFRFFFNKEYSMGTQIGFRNVGEPGSITSYKSKITNKDKYENEINFDALKNLNIFTNTSLTFTSDYYINIVTPQLSIIKNTAAPFDLFAKVYFSNNNTEVMIDSVITPPVYYYNPIRYLNELSFSFYDAKGNLFDFDNVDHSFILELTMVDNIPENTQLNSTRSNAK
jgi:hypothetical protein